jgi:hypothetical protein
LWLGPTRAQTGAMVQLLVYVVCLMLAAASLPIAAVARGGPDEVRVKGPCSGGATSDLRLRSHDDGRIDVRFEVEHSRAGAAWRVALVQERRIAWKGVAKATRPGGWFEVHRTLRDLPGTDSVAVGAWGPHGAACRASATLPDS